MAEESNKLMTPECRGAYVWLIEPKKNKLKPTEPGKYQMLLMLPKKAKTSAPFIAKLEKAMLAASQIKHGKVMPKAKLKHWPIKDGDDEENEEFHGYWLINVASKRKPGVISKSGRDLVTTDDVYSGAYYKATIHPWAWDNPDAGKGVSIDVDNVLKTKDGEPMAGKRPEAKDDFADEIDEDADESGDAEDDLV